MRAKECADLLSAHDILQAVFNNKTAKIVHRRQPATPQWSYISYHHAQRQAFFGHVFTYIHIIIAVVKLGCHGGIPSIIIHLPPRCMTPAQAPFGTCFADIHFITCNKPIAVGNTPPLHTYTHNNNIIIIIIITQQ